MDAAQPSNLCSRIMCKGMMTRAPENRDSVAFYDATVWWCLDTQKVVGPDDLPVSPGDCSGGRGCWKSRLAL